MLKEAPIISWIETFVITGIVLGLCFYFYPSDPFFFKSDFPWPWLAPIIIALRYGIMRGMASCIIIIITVIATEPAHGLAITVHPAYIAGGLLITLLCGEFRSNWHTRIRHANTSEEILRERLDGVLHSYHITKLSHQALEQSLLSQPNSLKEALSNIHPIINLDNDELNNTSYERFLNILCFHCSIEVAAIYPVSKEIVDKIPIAHFGQSTHLNPNDPLVIKTLENQETNFYEISQLKNLDENSKYLIAATFNDANDDCFAILLVEKINFWRLTKGNVDHINILVEYFAHRNNLTKAGKNVLQHFPNCTLPFAQEILLLSSLKKSIKINSALVGYFIPNQDRHDTLLNSLTYQLRDLDLTWACPSEKGTYLLVLLPFTGVAGTATYLRRMSKWLKSTFGITINETEVFVRYRQITGTEAHLEIQQILDDLNEL